MAESRVLLIDDDDLVAIALYAQLVANAVPVDLAREPDQAETLMRTNSYALVVMDAYLTGLLHGRATELVDRVQRLCPTTRIVLLTAYGSDELARTVSSLGGVTVVSKPQPVAHLTEMIDGYLHHGALSEAQVKP